MAKIKHHSLTGRITLDLMHRAFRSVRKNRGAAGIDKTSIAMFEANLEQNLLALMRDLISGPPIPRKGQSAWRRPVLERGSPVN